MKVWHRREVKRTTRSMLFSIRSERFSDDRNALFLPGWNCKRLRLPGRRTPCAAFRRRTFRMRLEPTTIAVRALPWSAHTYVPNVVIRTPLRDEAALRPFVEEAIKRGVRLFAAVGPHSMGVEHLIDLIMVGDRFDPARSRLTTAHDSFVDALTLIKSPTDIKRFFEVWL